MVVKKQRFGLDRAFAEDVRRDGRERAMGSIFWCSSRKGLAKVTEIECARAGAVRRGRSAD
jgi:hypothetical protein